ncbi:sulfate/thiosulfate ABC transporter ATP-binding protein CysA [Providencia sneebia]|uniref:Sulfate/thiosulfate transporter subunit n=1 Tax=Providencia sneebia DSM 19967 TaxID=1141660 RepID=K8WHF4_9GAMM|nr:sulfate/thiosulfate ABC transporter ATP-binding protein CysA [Providencia sneebia]EKT55700.1 sulfate/thiosulfate transporter subunit [Providencia sneebia DSM 19967]
MSIQIDKVGKLFGKTQVLNDISLDIASGEMVALLGPSGSGKTTLLRIIAGLEQHSYGSLRFHGQDVSRIHAKDRHVGFVFQHYALFRHMTVFDNVAFGLTVMPRKERPSAQVIKQKVMQLLEMVQLSHLASRYPSQLSGGQKQRVALARALAIEPQILLLDEPFGALDAQVRIELRRWLRQLHDELKFTSVFVTHDQEEAMEVADRIVVMSQGHIEQVGTPDDIWLEPATRFVLEFMGEINQLHGHIKGSQLNIHGYEFPLPHTSAHQGEVDVFLRPWDISLSKECDAQHRLPIRIIESGPRGHFWQLTVQPIGWGNEPLSVVWQSSQAIPARGESYFLGSQKAKIYQGDNELVFRQLAQSA